MRIPALVLALTFLGSPVFAADAAAANDWQTEVAKLSKALAEQQNKIASLEKEVASLKQPMIFSSEGDGSIFKLYAADYMKGAYKKGYFDKCDGDNVSTSKCMEASIDFCREVVRNQEKIAFLGGVSLRPKTPPAGEAQRETFFLCMGKMS